MQNNVLAKQSLESFENLKKKVKTTIRKLGNNNGTKKDLSKNTTETLRVQDIF